jgi:Lon protease-like protein
VLVPTERVPLHIFEPRYRELIGECLDADEEFGVLLQEQGEERRTVGTRAAVTDVLGVLPDGRMNIAIEGRERFRVVELHDDRSFLTATTAAVEDDPDPPDPADVEAALDVFVRLQQVVGSKREPPDAATPQLDFEIVARVDFGNPQKQELLELTSPRLRLVRLVELLEHALEALTLERQMQESASRNGKVPRPGR